MANQHKRPAFTILKLPVEGGYARASGAGSRIYRVELVLPDWVYLSYLGYWAWGRWKPAQRSRCFVARRFDESWTWGGKFIVAYKACQRTEFTPKEIP